MCLPVKPFRVEREWKAFGLSCAVVQNREAGHRCGYVRVPPSHPAYRQDYNDLDVSVHGGLTFADLEPCDEHEDGQGLWLGFDCGHWQDASVDPNINENDPNLSASARELIRIYRRNGLDRGGHFWSQKEVEAETEHLAQQLAAMKTV